MINHQTNDKLRESIQELEDHIQGHINDSITMMGFDFFGDDYLWEEDQEVISLRKRLEALREAS